MYTVHIKKKNEKRKYIWLSFAMILLGKDSMRAFELRFHCVFTTMALKLEFF